MSTLLHPADALFEDGQAPVVLPVVDHYCGVEARMIKSLELQARMGPVFDITLDCEDGAPVGGEAEHMLLVLHLLNGSLNAHGRVGVRVHPFNHPAFEADVEAVIRVKPLRPDVRLLSDILERKAGNRFQVAADIVGPAPLRVIGFQIENHR